MSRPHESYRRILAACGAAVALFAAAPAQAYPEFPGVLQEELNLECLPSCLLCHTRSEGGKGYLKDGGATALDRKSTRLNSSHSRASRMPSSA